MTTSITDFTLPNSQPDVQIHTPTQTFTLHSHILKLHSRWFAASMSDTWWKSETQTTFRYCYRLDYDKDGVSSLLPLKEKDVGEERDSIDTNTPTEDKTNDTTPHPDPETINELSTAFENMFKSFYQKLLHNLTPKECTALISLADQYDALHSVSDSIRANLLEWDNLDDHIEKNPLEFLFISYKLHWTRAYKECFIHTVGMHCGKLGVPVASLWAGLNLSIPDPIALLIQSECDKINQLLFTAMQKFLHLDGDETCDAVYIRNQAIRNEIGRCFKLYGNPGQEGSLFREIAESEFKPTIKDIEYCRKSHLGRPSDTSVLQAVGEIKSLASGLSKSSLSSKRNMSYLTCAEPLKDTELPWL